MSENDGNRMKIHAEYMFANFTYGLDEWSAVKLCRFKVLTYRMKEEGSGTTRGVHHAAREWLRYDLLDDSIRKPIGRVVLTKSVSCLRFDNRLVESLQNVVIDANPCEDR